MKIPKKHPHETERLKALQALNILDSLPETDFDEITQLAAEICEVPVALVSLVDEERQWFKSRFGLGASETPRDLAFCAHAILQDDLFYVSDAKTDPRFSDNPLVTKEPKVEFYAGYPIFDSKSNLPIGTLCVIDHKPNSLSLSQKESLKVLRNQIQRIIKMRSQIEALNEAKNLLSSIQERMSLILEGASLGSWDWDLTTNQVVFDKRWCEMIGLDPKTVSHNFETWDSRLHPDDRANAYQQVELHISGKSDRYEAIFRLRHSNGEWIWILAQGKVGERDQNGKALRFTGTQLNISLYKRNEFISEEIQKIANIGGWELDLSSGHTRWTDQTYNIHKVPLGTPTDKLNGIEFYIEEDRPRLIQCLSSCEKGEKFRETFRFIDAEGTKKWVEVSGIPSTDSTGKVTSILGTFQDVSEPYEVKVQLEEAQQMAKIGSWRFHIEDQSLYWSKENYAIFEVLEPQDPRTLFKTYTSMISIEDQKRLESFIHAAVERGEGFSFSHRVCFENGKREKFLRGVGRVTLSADGKPLMISGTCQDITEEVQSQIKVEESQKQAAHVNKMASIGEVAAGVAHEINNPLGIIGLASAALSNGKAIDSHTRNCLDMLNKATDRISRIVRGLKTFSRSAEQSPLSQELLSKILEDSLVLIDSKAKKQFTPIHVEIDSEARVQVNPVEIEQVMINLLNNALDAVRGLEQAWVRVKVFKDNGEVVVQVLDSGDGITKEIEEKMFQPFFTTKPPGSGTGLGLSISKGILESHGAAFHLNRSLGSTCFEVRFKAFDQGGEDAA